MVLRVFFWWEQRRCSAGREPLVDSTCCATPRLAGGLTMFLFQFLLQAGLFFIIPLFLSVALGLSALETGVRLLPLSVTLLVAAVGIPKLWPQASPRRVVRVGLAALLAGIVALVAGLDVGAGAESSPCRCCCRPRRRGAGLPARGGDGVGGARRAAAAKSAGCRTRRPTWAPRWARRWRARS